MINQNNNINFSENDFNKFLKIIYEDFKKDLSLAEFNESIQVVMENIPAIECIPAHEIQKLIIQLRKYYYDKIKPNNLSNYKKAITLGKEMSKDTKNTKADIARKMYEIIQDEEREIIVSAFVEGANLTSKGAMTYIYNIRRKLKK